MPTTDLGRLDRPADVRAAIRSGRFAGPTSGLAHGYLQVNLVLLPAADADDFRSFCANNPAPCPLVEETAPGETAPRWAAPDADLRTDLPRYWVLDADRDAKDVEELEDLRGWWSDDVVAFLIGCSFSFEAALLEAGLPLRHLAGGGNVPMYRTARPTRPAGRFQAPLVVSMRPIPRRQVEVAAEVCRRFPHAHGAPVWAGDPAVLGIADLRRPDFGDPVELEPGDVPVFWACGVTALLAARAARPERLVTHAPGHMLITDRTETEAGARFTARADARGGQPA